MENETFSMGRFLAMGLQKGAYFYPDYQLKPLPGYTVYNLMVMRRKKPRSPTYFFVPDRFKFILVPDKDDPGLLIIRRRDILKLRKNNPIKSTYRKLRATTLF